MRKLRLLIIAIASICVLALGAFALVNRSVPVGRTTTSLLRAALWRSSAVRIIRPTMLVAWPLTMAPPANSSTSRVTSTSRVSE